MNIYNYDGIILKTPWIYLLFNSNFIIKKVYYSKVHKKEQVPNILLKAGNQSAFNKLFENYYEKLCIYTLNFTSDKDLIQDIVQDSFITLWTNRKKIDITTSLKSYLYRIAYNKLMDSYRSNKKKDNMLLSYYNTTINQVIDNLDDNEDYKTARINKLNQCIAELPERCRKVFLAKKIKGLKYTEVSKELNISIKTVEGHVTKAYGLIRSCMNRNG